MVTEGVIEMNVSCFLEHPIDGAVSHDHFQLSVSSVEGKISVFRSLLFTVLMFAGSASDKK